MSMASVQMRVLSGYLRVSMKPRSATAERALARMARPKGDRNRPDFHYELGVRIFIHGAQAVAAAGADDQRLLL